METRSRRKIQEALISLSLAYSLLLVVERLAKLDEERRPVPDPHAADLFDGATWIRKGAGSGHEVGAGERAKPRAARMTNFLTFHALNLNRQSGLLNKAARPYCER